MTETEFKTYAMAECHTCLEIVLQRVEETEEDGVYLTCDNCTGTRRPNLSDFARIVNTIRTRERRR